MPDAPDIYERLLEDRRSFSESIPWPGAAKRRLRFQFSDLEYHLYERFCDSLKAGPMVSIDGFAMGIGNRKFLLQPSPAISEALLCDGGSLRKPPSGHQFVHVVGRMKMRKHHRYLTSIDNEIEVDEVSPITLPQDYLKPDIDLGDASGLLLEGYVDLDHSLARGLALSLTSSPLDIDRLGGLTTALLPVEEKYSLAVSELVQDIKAAVPKDLTADARLEIQVRGSARTYVPTFAWNMVGARVASSSRKTQDALFNRQRTSSPDLNELTIAISSGSVAPANAEELWMVKTDLPFLVDRLERYTSPKACDLDFAKYLITVHMNNPFESDDVDTNLLEYVKGPLGRLRRRYDRDGFGGFIDFDVRSGTPRSILHMARAIARAGGSSKVGRMHLDEALTQFEDTYEYVFSGWRDRGIEYSDARLDARLQHLDAASKRILEYVRRNPSSPKSEIREAFPRVTDRTFETTFQMLLKDGFIYCTSTIDDRYSAID